MQTGIFNELRGLEMEKYLEAEDRERERESQKDEPKFISSLCEPFQKVWFLFLENLLKTDSNLLALECWVQRQNHSKEMTWNLYQARKSTYEKETR